MRRSCGLLLLMIVVAGCKTPESVVQQLPRDAAPLTYAELLVRAKDQVAAAQEFFYRDSWRDVEQAALSLQQTADMLGQLKPEELPPREREPAKKLTEQAKELQEAAQALGESGRARDALKTTAAFQRLNLAIRELHAE